MPIDVLDFEVIPSESLYIDTRWSATATPTSTYPILVTSSIQSCVALALISDQKIGMYHVYPGDKDEKVINFIQCFREKDTGSIKVILVTGQVSLHLLKIYRILQANYHNEIHISHLPVINLPYPCDTGIQYHFTLLDKDKFMATPSIIDNISSTIAIDARSGKISVNFDLEKFKRESEKLTDEAIMDKAIKARKAGMEIRFEDEDWDP